MANIRKRSGTRLSILKMSFLYNIFVKKNKIDSKRRKSGNFLAMGTDHVIGLLMRLLLKMCQFKQIKLTYTEPSK